ncbi:uncharacterized protein LOC108091294 [Drosophila ficusphila]|uniref:uncharacterized protein LOC108091294 n=1 Tax=Drosophila ficusphila TaxID=30025 RepID=UPI0007E64342|nr:uncharacterized protein LOC108091294 [Drosophila ficusphila]
MFNKSIVVALILCACYLGTIEARPGGGVLDAVGGGGAVGTVVPVATSLVSGAAAGATSSLGSTAVGQLGSKLPLNGGSPLSGVL